MKKVLFIDRDGTLIEEPEDCQVDAFEKIRLIPWVIPSLHALVSAKFTLIMVSNQDGLGTKHFPSAHFQQCHDFILELFASQGIHFQDVFICPHQQSENCFCRKPKTGLLMNFLQETNIDKNQSWVIGDRETDKQFAQNLNLPFLAVNPNHGWQDITRTILHHDRKAIVVRQTKETCIELSVILDSEATNQIDTPIGFFSHMLEQIAKHGGFNLCFKAKGDLDVDDHHLIEDSGLALGEALKKALGDKRGISRYGFTLPMDESLATIAIDLSGRSCCVFEGSFTREFVGGMATEMVPHFFQSFANGLNATLHVNVKGKNHHHMIESCFKALGRALRQAFIQCDNELPSTKGVL